LACEALHVTLPRQSWKMPKKPRPCCSIFQVEKPEIIYR